MKSGAITIGLALVLTAPFVCAADTPFSVSIRPLQESVLAFHDEFVLDITVTNTSGKLLTLVVFPTNEVCAIEATGPEGLARPLTSQGRQIVGNAPKILAAAGQNQIGHACPGVRLLPGQTFKESIRIDYMVDMFDPGTYSVRLRRKIPEDIGEGEVVSNTVNFNVLYNPVVEQYPAYMRRAFAERQAAEAAPKKPQ